MEYIQSLPNYIHKFKNDLRWEKYATEHYIFFFFPDSVAQKEIKSIAINQEKAYYKICSFLDIKDGDQKITYYFYPDEKTKKELMGDDWYAQAIFDEFCIHALYTNEIKPVNEHEDTHLLSLSWGFPIGLLQEGLAEYLVGHNWFGKSHKECLKEGLKLGLNLSPVNLLDYKSWLETPDKYAVYYYSLVATFTDFLITKYGKEKFKKAYATINRDATARENKEKLEVIYELSMDTLEKQWKNFIGR